LYRGRNAFASTLEEYDAAYRLHDSEMDAIRQVCLQVGTVPLLET